MNSSPHTELQEIFIDWLARFRLVRALRTAGIGLALGAGLALLLGAALTWGRLILPAELAWLAGALLLTGMLFGGLAGLLWPVERMRAARRFDRQFGLQERLSTALELAQNPASSSLTPIQLTDALEHARQVDLAQGLPLRLPWRSLLTALILCAITAGMAWGLRAQFELAQQRRDLEKAITAQAAEIEELSAQIEQLDFTEPQAQDAILQSLQATLQDLQAAETAEEALAVLAEGQAELQSYISPDSQATLQGLAQAGEALSQSDNSDLQAAGEALAQGDLAAAAQALESLDSSQLSAEELAQLAQDLSAAAQALQASQPATAAALQAAANAAAAAAASSDTAQAAQAASEAAAALQQAAGELQALQGQLQAGQAAMQAAAALAQAQAALGGGSAVGSTGANSGQSGPGSSTNPSQNSGAGGGAGRGEGEGSEGEGSQAAGTTPIQTGNGPGDGGLTPYDSLYIPQRLGGEGGPDVNLPGGNTPGDTVVGGQERPVGDPGSLQVPYVDALPYYSEVNRQAIDSGQVPLDLRDLVRRYFSALEP